jgi:hypothetical protein
MLQQSSPFVYRMNILLILLISTMYTLQRSSLIMLNILYMLIKFFQENGNISPSNSLLCITGIFLNTIPNVYS